jgi:hypothetical protein
LEQITIITAMLEVPKALPGNVAEFGCYKGLSTASLSLACGLTGRKLIVFDSFEGLPDPETVHNFDSGRVLPYSRGQYTGSEEEVKSNVGRYGDVGVCEFVKGYFDETLVSRNNEELFVLVFEDADLPSSVRAVLSSIWLKLQKGCAFFSHEARDREVVDIFFDQTWWRSRIGESAPGFVGSGVGIMTGPTRDWCCLGYTVRRAEKKAF